VVENQRRGKMDEKENRCGNGLGKPSPSPHRQIEGKSDFELRESQPWALKGRVTQARKKNNPDREKNSPNITRKSKRWGCALNRSPADVGLESETMKEARGHHSGGTFSFEALLTTQGRES